SNKGTCIIGYCGGNSQCLEAGSAPPITLAEFVTLDNSLDYYDVSRAVQNTRPTRSTHTGSLGEQFGLNGLEPQISRVGWTPNFTTKRPSLLPYFKLSPMALKLLHLLLVLSFIGVDAAVFTLQNNCRNTVWPGIQGGEGKAPLMNGGLRLRSGETVNISAQKGGRAGSGAAVCVHLISQAGEHASPETVVANYMFQECYHASCQSKLTSNESLIWITMK
ncbi:hypothetical protein CFP56_007299, partial [Quercus suber]